MQICLLLHRDWVEACETDGQNLSSILLLSEGTWELCFPWSVFVFTSIHVCLHVCQLPKIMKCESYRYCKMLLCAKFLFYVYNKSQLLNQVLRIFYVCNWKWDEKIPGIIIPLIHNALVFLYSCLFCII